MTIESAYETRNTRASADCEESVFITIDGLKAFVGFDERGYEKPVRVAVLNACL